MTLLVTGPRGAGKTTFCDLLFHELTVEAPIGPEGTRSLALFSHRASGEAGYDLEIRENSGRAAPLTGLESQVVPLARQSLVAPEWTGGILGPWVFSQAAFDGARTSFDRNFDALERGGLFLLDEVGPLELSLGRGYAPLLPRAAALPRFVVVVRPGLVDSLRGEIVRHARAPLTAGPQGPVTLVEVKPGSLQDQTECRRLLRRAAEALT